jgi:hypothetical protein
VIDWWKCPNGECQHGGVLHDVDELDDPRPTCCAEGCPCGHEPEPDRDG